MAVNIRSIIVQEWGPVTWNKYVCEDPIEGENFEDSDSQEFISPKEVVSLLLAEDTHTLLHTEVLPFSPLTKEMNPLLSVKPSVMLSEGNARQDNTAVSQGP